MKNFKDEFNKLLEATCKALLKEMCAEVAEIVTNELRGETRAAMAHNASFFADENLRHKLRVELFDALRADLEYDLEDLRKKVRHYMMCGTDKILYEEDEDGDGEEDEDEDE